MLHIKATLSHDVYNNIEHEKKPTKTHINSYYFR